MVKEVQLNTSLKVYLTEITKRDFRAVVLFVYFVLFQIVIIAQTPFIQINFLVNFYLAILFFFSHHLYLFLAKVKNDFWSYCLDFTVLFYLIAKHPILSSFNLIVILIFLFLAGSELSKVKTLLLTVFCSLALSYINLTAVKWDGAQNLLSLVLFNFSFMVVGFISAQYKLQLTDLSSKVFVVSRKLKSQQEMSQTLIKYMPVGISALNSENEILFSNSKILEELKLTDQDLLSLHQQTKKIINSEAHFYNTTLQQKKIYEISKGFYHDEDLDDKISLMMVNDITEVRHLQDQMRQREKLAAIGQLAAGIAHEIRNPLAGISGSIELLSSDSKNPDDIKLMKIILREIDRLNNLITEFLDYSRPAYRPDQKIDLALVLNEVLGQIKISAQTPKNLELISNINSAFVLGFSDQLKQAFLNIIMNGLQAMQKNETPKLIVSLKTDEQFALVSIKDFGQGMSEEIKKKIFEPFFTTKSKGTGLGLAITHKILETHETQVVIESELNQGTEFILKFKKVLG